MKCYLIFPPYLQFYALGELNKILRVVNQFKIWNKAFGSHFNKIYIRVTLWHFCFKINLRPKVCESAWFITYIQRISLFSCVNKSYKNLFSFCRLEHFYLL